MKNREFVIGDVHGCIKTLEKMLFDILKIRKEDSLYFLGDYIDRGPASKEVLDLLMWLTAEDYSVFPILGNHEFMLLLAAGNYIYLHNWIANGAQSTLTSFNTALPGEIPQKYLEFIGKMPYYYLHEKYIIVHAGMNFFAPDPFKDYEAMLWTRDEYVDLQITGGRKLITGHTPQRFAEIEKSLATNHIKLDGGCVYRGIHDRLGCLAALEINTMRLYNLDKID